MMSNINAHHELYHQGVLSPKLDSDLKWQNEGWRGSHPFNIPYSTLNGDWLKFRWFIAAAVAGTMNKS
jgi:hypothetical protein